jgi:hypothetical protein
VLANSENESVVLSNEFAEVRVEWGGIGVGRLQITDLGSGAVALLDLREAMPISERDPETARESRKMEASVDYAANGPRLKIADMGTGLTIYLDPLQLADAAVAAAWGKLPPAYDIQ